MAENKTVCIIGAGESGIAALKESVLQGLHPTCYDMDSDIGGLWHGKPSTEKSNTPSLWPNLATNNSKYNVCFSDFPPDPKDPVFMPPKRVYDYFKRLIEHFELEKFIHLNVKIVKICETPDHANTGRWEVYSENVSQNTGGGDTGDGDLSKCRKEVFDNVIICSGWSKKPFYPTIPGLATFKGEISHSFGYSNPRHFDGKRVLIVGGSLSAAEVVTDVANLAEQTFLALGKGTWIVPRMWPGQRPFDLTFPRSMIHSSNAEVEVNDHFLKQATSLIDYTNSGIGAKLPPTRNAVCISDDLPLKIASGHVIPYGNLVKFTEKEAIFQNGQTIPNLDAVIFCTGYKPELPFLDLEVHGSGGKLDMFMLTFPLRRKHNTLALIGYYRNNGPMIVMGEHQARLVTRVMTGKHKLPAPKAMDRNAEMWNNMSQMSTELRSINVPGLLFCDALAIEGGFYPSFWKLFLFDPLLAWRTWNGPYLAAQYRLVGPDSQWKQAREICYRGYSEGLSCVRHADVQKVERPDKAWSKWRIGFISSVSVLLVGRAIYVHLKKC